MLEKWLSQAQRSLARPEPGKKSERSAGKLNGSVPLGALVEGDAECAGAEAGEAAGKAWVHRAAVLEHSLPVSGESAL